MTDKDFESAVRTHADTIYRVARHALKRQHDAEDVTQTVLLKLYEHRGTFESPEHLKHWLLRVTVNECRKLMRSFWRRNVGPLEDWQDLPALEDPAKAELLQAVMALEPKYRLTVFLYYYEGCSVKEVAEAMQAKPSTVQTWLQRARGRLSRTLNDEEEETAYVRSKSLS